MRLGVVLDERGGVADLPLHRAFCISRFDAHDQKTLEWQREARDDEQKLIQSAQQAQKELEQLFEADAAPQVEQKEETTV